MKGIGGDPVKSVEKSMKKTVFGLLTVILLVNLVPVSAAAAGAQQFDCEKSGIQQEYVYRGWDGEWTLDQTKSYDYYPDGTIKTVTSTGGYWHYEGHYDPHGNLMDPTYTFFAGFVDGVLLDPSAKPIRKYDAKGRLTYFEARAFMFDAPEVIAIVKKSFEYDSQNRVSRVIETEEDEFHDEPYIYNLSFTYDSAGGYTITEIPQNNPYATGYDVYSRTVFTYDEGHRLVRYEYSSERIFEDSHYYSSEIEHFTYNEDGNLIHRQKFARSDDYTGSDPVDETQYKYRREDNKTLYCDVYSRDYKSGEMELQETDTYVFDDKGRVVREIYPGYEIMHSYNEPAKLSAGVEQSKPSVEDVRAFGSEITYPKKSSYLDAYETMVVRSEKGHSINVYWKANGEEMYRRQNYYIKEGAEVTVLAREGAFSCVIFTGTKDQKQHIGWVVSSLLAYS